MTDSSVDVAPLVEDVDDEVDAVALDDEDADGGGGGGRISVFTEASVAVVPSGDTLVLGSPISDDRLVRRLSSCFKSAERLLVDVAAPVEDVPVLAVAVLDDNEVLELSASDARRDEASLDDDVSDVEAAGGGPGGGAPAP